MWTQGPATDQAHDLTVAWVLYRSMVHGDPSGMIQAWMHASPVHTPFVPFISALFMVAFGESRIAAEAVLPVFTTVWLVATYFSIRRLYDANTAAWATAFVSSFPLFLTYSRTYLFEHPLAAMFACACYALLASEGFSRTLPTAAFSVLAGLTCLTRGGAPVYFAGPLAVTLWQIRALPDRGARLQRLVWALGGAALIAMSWYGANAASFLMYIHRATYGQDAAARAGSPWAFSAANADYYLTWLVAQGPGVPILLLTAACIAVGRLDWTPSRTGTALMAVFAIDFVLLLTAAQHETARYFQPLMPLVAIGFVRTIAGIQSDHVRRVAATGTIGLALHHVIAFTPIWHSRPSMVIPYAHGIPLWNHKSYFASVTDFYGIHPTSQDFRVSQTIELLAAAHLPSHAVIATLQTPHPFFQPNALQLEAVRRGLEWRFTWVPFLVDADAYLLASEAVAAANVDVVLLRSGGTTTVDLERASHAFPFLFAGKEPGLVRLQPELTLGDGSRVTAYVASRTEQHDR